MIGRARSRNGTLICISDVNHWFGVGESRSQVLFNNTMEIDPGQLIVMSGPSGSGKTTLLTLIGALRSIQDGDIEFAGRSLKNLTPHELAVVRRDIGFIFQLHNLFDSLTAYEHVKMAMQLSNCPATDMRRRGTAILERIGLGHRVDSKPQALSGGQRQRVAIARALVNEPKLVLADEPTAALDADSSRSVMMLLKQLAAQQGATIFIVTHDSRILEYADRLVNMVDGHIVSDVVVRDAVAMCELLRNIDLFKAFTPVEIANLADRMRKQRYSGGQTIIRQGEHGEEFFLIASGTVQVTKQQPGQAEQELALLGFGDFFGEAALITGGPRNATVTAAVDVEAYVLAKEDFQKALELNAAFEKQVVRAYFQRQSRP